MPKSAKTSLENIENIENDNYRENKSIAYA